MSDSRSDTAPRRHGPARWALGLLPLALFAVTVLAYLLLVPASLVGTHCVMDGEASFGCGVLESAVIVGTVAAPFVLLVGAAGAVAGGVLWKLTLVTRACHQQGFALPRVPRRGSGTRAAPARFGLG